MWSLISNGCKKTLQSNKVESKKGIRNPLLVSLGWHMGESSFSGKKKKKQKQFTQPIKLNLEKGRYALLYGDGFYF